MRLDAVQLLGIAISSSVAAAGLFSILLWAFRRSRRSPLYAGLTSVLAAYFAFTNTLQLDFGPGPINQFFERTQFISLVALSSLLLLFARALASRPLGWLRYLLPSAGVVVSLLLATTDLVVTHDYERKFVLAYRYGLEPAPGPLALPSLLYMLTVGLVAGVEVSRLARSEGRLAWVVYAGTALAALTGMNDILAEFGVSPINYTFMAGVLGVGAIIATIALREHLAAVDEAQRANSRLAQAVTARTRELRDAQARLAQEQQLAVLGRLSAGVAHELANPLTVLEANLTYLQESASSQPPDSNRDAAVQEGLEACRVASRIVKDLAGLGSRRGSGKAEKFVLARPVGTALRFLTRANPLASKVEVELDESVLVVGDETRLGQVATNLLENALQAIEDLPSGAGRVRVVVRKSNSHAQLVVEDNGPGVPNDLRTQIFDPFFTTKAVGRGTGLGLSICARIATDHRGNIEVTDSSSGGACFTVSLPLDG